MRSVRMPEGATPAEIMAVVCKENAPAWTDGHIVEISNRRPDGYHLLGLDKTECALMFGGCPRQSVEH